MDASPNAFLSNHRTDTSTAINSVSPGLVDGNGTESKPKTAIYVPNIPGRSEAVGWLDTETSFCRSKASAEAPKNDSDIVLNGKLDFLNVSKKTKEKRNQQLNAYLREQQVRPPTSTCANADFNTWAYCAKANFYGVNGINKAFFGGEKPPNQTFKDMAEFEKYGFMQDMVLLMVDGCISCNNPAGMGSALNLS
uniref:Sulfatase domain-containing protein n=1 Tax=Globodera pallida TaxID=36090 RepID=A0A183CNZ8_GLOPA